MRQKRFLQQRKLVTTPLLLQEKKKQNNSNIEKKTENKGATFQKGKKRIYYKFLCKCGIGFNSFLEFLIHINFSHKIENINFIEILAAKRNRSKRDIKFYWHLSCQCGHKFSSSLCSADLKVNSDQIEIVKKYRHLCLKCNEIAKFDQEELLDDFLKERVMQGLIYSFYKEKFAQFKRESHTEKMLEGHKRELCEKCQSLGRYCGEELIYQEQINQIHHSKS
ncbi:hypothetical protein C1645_823591 [Glomus cerebriforme]|uniref:3CxxC-type domain-containing protein n=1 Tax=Glomus cerebriforme TaxID=658196 RepID=A0A397T5F6_9GLOM|nr:hypothetical protein C1645_823591 [Glomus cerebriforme]